MRFSPINLFLILEPNIGEVQLFEGVCVCVCVCAHTRASACVCRVGGGERVSREEEDMEGRKSIRKSAPYPEQIREFLRMQHWVCVKYLACKSLPLFVI